MELIFGYFMIRYDFWKLKYMNIVCSDTLYFIFFVNNIIKGNWNILIKFLYIS